MHATDGSFTLLRLQGDPLRSGGLALGWVHIVGSKVVFVDAFGPAAHPREENGDQHIEKAERKEKQAV